MKLLTKSTFYYLILSVLAMVAGGAFLYLSVKKVVYTQTDYSLVIEKTILENQIELLDSVPALQASFGHQIEVKLFNYPIRSFQSIKDTDIYNPATDSFTPFRYIFASGNTPQQKGFIITIYRITEEKNELLQAIGLYMFFLFFSLFIISILINYLIARKLWRPFYDSVNMAE